MANEQLTPRQLELFQYLEDVQGREHRMPSYREMANAMKLSAVGSIQDLVSALIEKGYLRKNGRHLSLSEKKQSSVVQIPIVGVVAAGSLTEAMENNLGVLPFSSDFVAAKTSASKFKANKKVFALRVQGQSMIDAGIFEGDYVVVQTQPEYKSGETVVARYQGEATVKEIYFKSKEIVLHPRNSGMKDIVFTQKDSNDLEILGRVIALQRILS
jgi:repressor LexA